MTNSFADASWKDFWSEENFDDYPQHLTPKFWPVEDAYQLRQEKAFHALYKVSFI